MRELDRLDRRILSVETLPMKLATIEVELSGVKEDVARIQRMLEDRVKERQTEQKTAVENRRKDRQWLVVALLMTAGLVISAMALLFPLFQAGGGG